MIVVVAVSASASRADAASCEAITTMALPAASITAAETVALGQYKMPAGPFARIAAQSGMNLAGRTGDGANPAFCRVAAILTPTRDSRITIEVWLPLSGWNGKFFGVGNFGWAGSLMQSGVLTGLEQRYAVASTDTGHDDSKPDEQGGRFALGHPEKLIDYAYRADHLMTLDAKAIIKAFYGVPPVRSYWGARSAAWRD